MLDSIDLHDAPDPIDLTDPQHLAQVRELAERLLSEGSTASDLERREHDLVGTDVSPAGQLVVKLARSRRLVDAVAGPMHLSVVFAAYKEHQRIRPRSAANPHGEDFLRRKAEQLDWLLDGPNRSWELLLVDDGCPNGTGRIAQEIIDEAKIDNARVLFLAEAIDRGLAVTQPLKDTAGSQKGGSILYGMAVAAEQRRPGHVVMFTDADLSTHLGQCGLLAHPIRQGGWDAAIGSRREPTSVVVKQKARNDRGKLFIYLWKRLIHSLGGIVDTQCGFKAWRANIIHDIVGDNLERRFAFDIELLVKTLRRRPDSVCKVPVAWIDSEALSTTAQAQPYLPMLQTSAALYRRYLPANDESDAFARFIDELDEARWQRLLEHIPEAITSREPAGFGSFAEVSPEELADRARG